MTTCLLGLGTARPEREIDQRDAAALAIDRSGTTGRAARALTALYRRTAIESRGITLLDGDGPSSLEAFYPPRGGPDAPGTAARMRAFERLAPGLAERAARSALDDAAIAAGDVTHLVLATCTGFAAPGIDIALVDRLGLRPSVVRTIVGFMGCHAALSALPVADAHARADEGARVLVVCVELCSLHFQHDGRPDQHVANALFADGAAALVVGSGGTARQWRVLGTASRLLPGTRDAMRWEIGDRGFLMTLSPAVPDLVGAHLLPWLADWLAARGVALGDVAGWAIHAGGPRIVSAVAERLGLPGAALDASRAVLRECGNMSSATVPFILRRLRDEGTRPPVVAMAFGPGLTVEVALLGEGSEGPRDRGS